MATKVLVYTLQRDVWKGKPRPPLVIAYLRYQGDGGCPHTVDENGEHAKASAIRAHRAKCMSPEPAP